MSWSIKLSGVEISPEKIAITHRLRDLDSFNIAIPNNQFTRDLVGYKNSVDVYYRGNQKIIGRSDRPVYRDRTIGIAGREMANELFDDLIDIDQAQDDTKIVSYENTGADNILVEILELKGWALASTEPTDHMSIRFEYQNIYDGVKAIADFLDKDFWFLWITETSKYCYFSGNRGTDRGEITYLGTSDKEVDYDDIENDITIFYLDKSDNSLSVNVTDNSSISTYGSKSTYYTTTEGFDASTVRRLAQAILSDKKDPITRIPIKLATQYLYDSDISVGDDIYLDIPEKDIADTYEIKKITIGTYTSSIDTSTERDDINTIIKSLKKDAELRYRSRKTCVYTCQITCQEACQQACEGDPCQTACQAGCETTCEGACQTTCQTGCQTTCQAGCMVSCRTGCQTTCETGCETSCQTGCQTSCQTICESCCEFCGQSCYNMQNF